MSRDSWTFPRLTWGSMSGTPGRSRLTGLTSRSFGSGGGQLPERPVIFRSLRGEVDLDFSRAAPVGEGRVPAVEVASQIVVQDGGADLEEELGTRR